MDYTALTVALLSFIASILVWVNSRKQVNVDDKRAGIDVVNSMIKNALDMVNEYQEIAQDAQKRVVALQEEYDSFKAKVNDKHKEYDAEFDSAAKKIDELSVTNLKYQIILSIYLYQLRDNAIEPLIHPDEFDSKTIHELRQIADALSNRKKWGKR